MLLAVTLLACASECDDLSRINGDYEVVSTVETHEPADLEAMPTYSVFFNGLWDWKLQYLRDSGNVRLTIDGQETTARYESLDGSCNAMALHIPSWSFVGDATGPRDTEDVDATHVLEWDAELVWQGEEISGAYTVLDTWSTSSGLSGSMTGGGSLAGVLIQSE